MSRSSSVLTLVLATLVAGSLPASAATPDDDWLRDAITDVAEEIVLLHDLGALTPEPLVDDVVAALGPLEPLGLDDRIDDLLDNEIDGSELLLEAELTDLELGEPVVVALDWLSDAAYGDLYEARTGFLDPMPYVDALTDLVRRGGLAPPGPRVPGEADVLADALLDLEEGRFEPAAYAEQAPGPGPDDGPPVLWIVVAALAAAGGTLLLVRRRAGGGGGADSGATARPTGSPPAPPTRPAPPTPAGPSDRAPTTQTTGPPTVPVATGAAVLAGWLEAPGPPAPAPVASPAPAPVAPPQHQPARSVHLADVLDTSRRMTAALDGHEVQRIAVRDAVRLTGADVGAFLLATGGVLRFSAASDPAFFTEGPGLDGVLARVVATGVSTHAVVHDEPALVQLPMALAAAPVIADGGVVGALVVLRTATRPFDGEDVDTLELLTPITGSALAAAEVHRGAVAASEVDGLTQLKNRRRLDTDLAQLPGTDAVAFAMVDIDHFKMLNDTHGHAAGDVALQLVARTLADTVRSKDVVYRYGGEEFSLVLHACDRQEAATVVERVRAAVEALEVPGGATQPLGRVTISVGVAHTDGAVDDDLCGRADRALYAAKESGRNRVVWAD
jgi:diguanylate cyclase (GGDEF)-like protein